MRHGLICVAIIVLISFGPRAGQADDTTHQFDTATMTKLAETIASATSKLPDIIFFNVASFTTVDLDSDTHADTAVLALAPKDMIQPDDRVFLIVRLTGSALPLIAEIPVNDAGLCAATVTLGLEKNASDRPVLVVDDGACDAYRFEVEGTPPRLVVSRN
ncbi:hypothetical protein [Desulfovibrio inopinatus]|uniref:hypothetical protein n=1 Tax=Desulfovibrio inopinatus TaxID=102109 RepID=UPI0003F8BC9B|nr:hypothetical protein [Desulfovibrio inopinatus]